MTNQPGIGKRCQIIPNIRKSFEVAMFGNITAIDTNTWLITVKYKNGESFVEEAFTYDQLLVIDK